MYHLIDEVAVSRQPLLITGKRSKAGLLSEEDWEAVQETFFLLSAPGMRESIREGMAISVEECRGNIDWRVGA